MRKLILITLFLLLALAGLQLWRLNQVPPEDSTGRERIVSLAPNLTAILFALGLGDQVVGVTTYCDDPVEAQTREKVGSFLSPNLEKILALDPHLVVAEEWGSSRTVPRLKQLGLEVLEVPTPQSIGDIRQLIEELGEILSRKASAAELVAKMDGELEQIVNRAEQYSERARLYLEIDIPAWTVGSASFTNEALEIAGFENIFRDLRQPAPRVASEAIIERDPDIIISFAAEAEQVAGRPGWQNIRAVQRRWVIDDFPEAWLSRGSHRLSEGMLRLQDRIERLPGWKVWGMSNSR